MPVKRGAQSSKSEIMVSVRIRPGPSPVVGIENGKVAVPGKLFGFPSHIVKGSDQGVAFRHLASVLIARAKEGYNCTLMAYGQTGSGKTHTMFGPPGSLTEASVQQQRQQQQEVDGCGETVASPEAWGLFPRTVLELFRLEGVQSVHASAVEVYHDKVFDLMDERAPLNINATKPAGTRVKGRADLGGNGSNEKGVGMAKNGVHPASCNCFGCFKAKEAAKEAAKRAKQGANKRGGRIPGRRTSQLDQGCGKRVGDGQANFTTVGERLSRLGSAEDLARFARTVEATRTAKSHLLNDRSSRSHCLVKVHLKRGSARSSLLFVDLAGSERTKRTGAQGEARAEAVSINSSLTALGRVIKALGGGNRQGKGATGGGKMHVPYRDAALTMLLRDSFGGRSCTSVVITVAGEAEHVEESACSLSFGQRMSVVRNRPTIVSGDGGGGGGAKEGEVLLLLEEARARAAQLTEEGQAGGFVEGCFNSEKESLQKNMHKLAACEEAIRRCITQITERRGAAKAAAAGSKGAKGVGALSIELRALTAQAEVLRGIVGRQQTIKALWLPPSPAYQRQAARVRELEGQAMLHALI